MSTRQWIRQAVPPGIRAAIRDRLEWGRELTGKARLWQWTLALVRGGPIEVVYAGRLPLLGSACALVAPGLQRVGGPKEALSALRRGGVAIVSDAPLRGALHTPSMLSTILPASPEALGLRARQRALIADHRLVSIADERGVERVYREMLEPYATERHGPGAVHLALETVRSLARIGRLDVLLLDGVEVAAMLGCPLVRGGKRYWIGRRVGYPAQVFLDERRLADTHLINLWFSLREAERLGFDLYDMGRAIARPEDGVLQWKRQRGGWLDSWGNHHRVWIRPPARRAPAFLWTSPLFSVERRGIFLNVGMPATVSEQESLDRFGRFRFGGLAGLRIHSEARLPAGFVEELRHRSRAIAVEITDGRGTAIRAGPALPGGPA